MTKREGVAKETVTKTEKERDLVRDMNRKLETMRRA